MYLLMCYEHTVGVLMLACYLIVWKKISKLLDKIQYLRKEIIFIPITSHYAQCIGCVFIKTHLFMPRYVCHGDV